jgi:hypothetical protein
LSLVLNKNNKIFLSSDTKIETSFKVDIILSPEFYWIRIFDIPVKNISQARDVLSTLFEDIIDNTNDLSYQVLKLEENKYLCFAYCNKKIYEAIKDSGINLSLVNSVYFAQNECKDFKQFNLEDKSFLYTEDGILVKVPNDLILEKLDLNEHINSITLSSNKVDIKLYNNILSRKQISFISIVCLLVSFINFIKIYDYKSESNNIEKQINDEKVRNNLPSSILQVDSIINKYKAISNTEIQKREAFHYILKNNNFEINSLVLEKDILILNIKNNNKKRDENYINKKYKIISSQINNSNLDIRIKL